MNRRTRGVEYRVETRPSHSLKEQRVLKEKLTDLQARAQRNNIQIFGVPEGVEGNSVPRYVEDLLQRELELLGETRLLI